MAVAERHSIAALCRQSEGPGKYRRKVSFVSGSNKEAITHHYDVSNEFYQLFLDERMVYTCAYFTDWQNSLDQAQHDKLDLICRKLRLKPGDRFLDIGCGWGALLIHAVQNYGVIGTGVSLSEAQTALARQRIKSAGLEDKITIHIKSYTELDQEFDKISSIGMFEHVGIANYDTYFKSVRRLLRPGGLYMHHAITRRMKKNKKSFNRKSAEHLALVKYIFPGGELDHLGMTVEISKAMALRCMTWKISASITAAPAACGRTGFMPISTRPLPRSVMRGRASGYCISQDAHWHLSAERFRSTRHLPRSANVAFRLFRKHALIFIRARACLPKAETGFGTKTFVKTKA